MTVSLGSSGAAQLCFASRFVLRVPLMPVESFLGLGRDLSARGVYLASGDLDAALLRDEQVVRARLRGWLAEPCVREALGLASPSLWARVEPWQEAQDATCEPKLERALIRYFTRMGTRATPLGLLASITEGRCTSQRTSLQVGNELTRHLELDADLVHDLAFALASRADLRSELTYEPNPTHYDLSDSIRYTRRSEDGRLHLAAVHASPFVRAALSVAVGGANREQLRDAIAQGGEDVDASEVDEFVEELIESQLLLPQLAPSLSGPPPAVQLQRGLERLPSLGGASETVRFVRAQVESLRGAPFGVRPSDYQALTRPLLSLSDPAREGREIDATLLRSGTPVIGPEVLADLSCALSWLWRTQPEEDDPLAEFAAAYGERYGDASMPLGEVLDQDRGIGFGAFAHELAPLLSGLELSVPTSTPPPAREAALLDAWLKQGGVARELALTDLEAGPIASASKGEPPSTFCARFSIMKSASLAFDPAPFQVVLHQASGPGGTGYLARFCAASGDVEALVREHARTEEVQHPDVIHAEVLCASGRDRTLLSRPQLRSYEIPLLACSTLPASQQITLSDLRVRVVEGRVELYSERLGRRVVPTLSTAQRPEKSPLSAYRFLATLARARPWQWSWGSLLSQAAFLPRVRLGRVILAPASYRLPSTLPQALRKATSAAERFSLVQAARDALALPRYVQHVESDAPHVVDLDNSLSVAAFTHALRMGAELRVEEVLPHLDENAVHGEGGSFVHEIILPGYTPVAPSASVAAPSLFKSPGVRKFAPGSEWYYLKLYGSPFDLERLLLQDLGPRIRELLRADVIDRWFFVRYRDSHPQLRLRAHGLPQRLLCEAAPALLEACQHSLAQGRLWKVEVATYEREVERYGGDRGMSLAESWFHLDSEACLFALGSGDGEAGADQRWQVALAGIDMLMRQLGLDPEARHTLAEAMAASFRAERKLDASFNRAISERFRRDRHKLSLLLAPQPPTSLVQAFAAFEAVEEPLTRLGCALSEAEREGVLSRSKSALFPEFLHMRANRLLRERPREHELVMYELLRRFHRAERGRALAAASHTGRSTHG